MRVNEDKWFYKEEEPSKADILEIIDKRYIDIRKIEGMLIEKIKTRMQKETKLSNKTLKMVSTLTKLIDVMGEW